MHEEHGASEDAMTTTTTRLRVFDDVYGLRLQLHSAPVKQSLWLCLQHHARSYRRYLYTLCSAHPYGP